MKPEEITKPGVYREYIDDIYLGIVIITKVKKEGLLIIDLYREDKNPEFYSFCCLLTYRYNLIGTTDNPRETHPEVFI